MDSKNAHYESAKKLKSLLEGIRDARGENLGAVYEIVSERINRLMAAKMMPFAPIGWEADTIRLHTIPGRNKTILPQQFLDAFTAVYCNLVSTVNYQDIISLYTSNGSTIDAKTIDLLGQAGRDEDSWQRFINNSSIKKVDLIPLVNRYITNVAKEHYDYLVANGLSTEQIDNLNIQSTLDPMPLKEYEEIVINADLPISTQISNLRIKERIATQNNFVLWITGTHPFTSLFYNALVYTLALQSKELIFTPIDTILCFGGLFTPYLKIDDFKEHASRILPGLSWREETELANYLNFRLKNGKAVILFFEKVLEEAKPQGVYEFFPYPKAVFCFTCVK